MKPVNACSRYVLKALGFTLAFAALFLALQPAFADTLSRNQASDRQSARAFFRAPKDALDVIYLGNSHTVTFFSSAMLDELLGTRSYNLGSGAENIQQVYFDLKQALEYQRPSCAVVEVSAARPDLRQNTLAQKCFQTSRYPFGWNKVQAILSQFEPAEYPAALLPLLRNHSRWKQPAELLSAYARVFQTDTSIPAGRGWRAAPVIAGMETESQLGDPNACRALESDLSAGSEKYLDAIVALARQRDVGLIFVKTPQRQYLGCRDAALEQFAERNGIPLYDYNMMAFSKTLSRVHYADLVHLNEFGAVPFNLHWAGMLAKELGKNVDEAAKARYEAIAVVSLLEETDGKQVTYTLVPAIAGANLRYSWRAELNGALLARSGDASLSNSFALDTSAPGSYRISLEVRDAARPQTVLAGRLTRRTKGK